MAPKSSSAVPKTVLDKVEHAVRQMADPTGSSRQAIVKFLKREYDVDNANAIKKALKTGVDGGRLIQKGQSFNVKGLEFKPPADEQVTIEEVTMKYRGALEDGTEFDAASRFEFTLGAGEVIKGWEVGVRGMRVGGKRRLTVPPKLGYGKRGSLPEIPPSATLVFDVELLAVK